MIHMQGSDAKTKDATGSYAESGMKSSSLSSSSGPEPAATKKQQTHVLNVFHPN